MCKGFSRRMRCQLKIEFEPSMIHRKLLPCRELLLSILHGLGMNAIDRFLAGIVECVFDFNKFAECVVTTTPSD